jgi:uncharacterized membrane protein
VAVSVPIDVALRGRTGPPAVALRVLARLATLGELAGDKLPMMPSRLEGRVLDARIVAGALGAVGLAIAERRPVALALLAAPLGAAGAYLGSYGGASWRHWAADQGPSWVRPDARAAVIEDAVVVTTAALLVRTARKGDA